MSISLPNLDDRRWADLVDEGRTLLPVYAAGWTDHNVSDPGITLIELFASLTEQELYRLNRITARQRTKFLELVGGLPKEPRPARAVIAFQVRPCELAAPVRVPAGCEFEQGPRAPVFRTLYPVRVGGAVLRALQIGDGPSFRAVDSVAEDGFFPFGPDPQPGAALYLGFDRPLQAGERTSLYVDAGASGVGTDVQHVDTLCDPTSVSAHHSARLRWEYRDASGRWLFVPNVDATRAWTLDGHVWLDLPERADMSKTRLGSVAEPLHYLRVRLEAGQFDSAPHVRSVLCDAVEAEQAQTWHAGKPEQGVLLGVGDGAPRQRLLLPAAPALASSLHVWTVGADGTREVWQARADLAASSAADRHFVFLPTPGELRFGDGRFGRCLERADEVRATFASTSADRGLLHAQSALTLADSLHNRFLQVQPLSKTIEASLPIASADGMPAETLGQAIERAARDRESARRAVTLTDYEELARSTPGTQIARVHALANHHPAFDCIKAPGVITLIIVPSLPPRAPQPSAGLRTAVREQLRSRRVLGTRFEVVGPTYLEVAVHARVRLLNNQRPERVQRAIVNALDTMLDPLRGGPDGAGWPFGRDVYRAEILQTIDEVPGVDHVLGLQLLPAGCGPVCGNVCLKPTWLTRPGTHRVEVI